MGNLNQNKKSGRNNESSSPDASAIFVLSTLLSFAGTWLLLQIGPQVIVGQSSGKIIQLSIPPTLGLIGGLIGLIFSNSSRQLEPNGRINTLAFVLALALILGMISRTIPFADIPNELWEGFGPFVTFICLAVTCLVVLTRLHPLQGMASSRRAIFYGLCGLTYLSYLPTYLQPPGGIININDTTYHVLDEMLAPLSGQLPHSTYMPTYTAMFGWVLAPLSFFNLNPSTVMVLTIVAANIFFLSIPILIAIAIKRLEPRVPVLVVPLFVVPLLGISGRMNGSSTVLSGFSTFGRFFFPYLVLTIAAYALTARSRKGEVYGYVLFGISAAVALFNNADFCFSFVVATFISLATAFFTRQIRGIKILLFGAGFSGFALSYVLILQLGGRGFDLKMYSSLVLLGQKGDLYFYEMAKFGPHLLVFISAVSTVGLGVAMALQERRRPSSGGSPALNIMLLQSGLWTLALLMMFAVRPIIPFATQQLLLPMMFNFMLIAIAAFRNDLWRIDRGSMPRVLRSLPLTVVLALPIASIVQLPNPIDEAKRVSGHARHADWSSTPGRAPADGWTPQILRQQGTLHHPGPWLEAIEKFKASYRGDSDDLGYFGYMGNTVQLITGIKNVMGVSGPEHMRFGPYFEEQGCAPIARLKPRIVVVYASPVPCTSLQYLQSDSSGLLQIYLVHGSARVEQ